MSASRESAVVSRNVEAVQVPEGFAFLLKKDTRVTISQMLGGTITVVTDHGHMVRVDGKDADALGKDPALVLAQAGAREGASLSDLAWDALRSVYDPEIPVNIVDLGLVYECRVEDGRIGVKMTLTAPGCGMGDVLKRDAERKLAGLPGVSGVQVELVLDPPWDQSRMTEAARLQLGI